MFLLYPYVSGYPLHRENREMAKMIPGQGKHREFGNFAKTQGIWFAQVVNLLILKVKDISKFAAKSQFSLCDSHKSRKLAQ